MPRRTDGRPKTARRIVLTDDQYRSLELIAARALGTPSISSLIRAALDDFIRRQASADTDLAADLERERRSNRVVRLRPVKGDE